MGGELPQILEWRVGRLGNLPTGTPRREGTTWGGWLSRVEARRTPIPAACSPHGLQRAHRRHRRGLGFIYPDRRARPGNRDSEVFSCFLTAQPSRRTSCGPDIHVPGRARGSSLRPPLPLTLAEKPAPPGNPRGPPTHWKQQEQIAFALEEGKLEKLQIVFSPGAGDLDTNGYLSREFHPM